MRYPFVWILGSITANALMDVMITIRRLEVKPTAYGVVKAMFVSGRLDVPSPYRGCNIYFSMAGSWITAVVAVFAIILLSRSKK